MMRGEDAVEPLPGLVIRNDVGQILFLARHDGQTLDESMQALKALVIFMGALIVIMMGVVAYTIVVKFGKVGDDTAAIDVSLIEGQGAWAGGISIALPKGARVAETVVGDGRMVVRLVLPDDSQRYLVFDLNTGKQVGTIDLAPDGGGQ